MIKIAVPIAATKTNMITMKKFVKSPEFQMELLTRFYNDETKEYEYEHGATVEVGNTI